MKSPLLQSLNAHIQTRPGLARWAQTLALLAFFIPLSLTELSATNFVVNSSSDANSGSGTTGTLRYCITQANMSAGPHNITFTVSNVTFAGTDYPQINRQMTIDGGPSKVVISCTAGNATVRPFFLIGGASGSTLKNLDIRGGGYEPIRIDGSPTNITIQHLKCSNSNGDWWNYGIYITGNASNYLIEDYIMENIENPYEAIQIAGTSNNVTIDKVRIIQGPGTSGMGMRFIGVATNVAITNCYIGLDAQESTDGGDRGIRFETNVSGLTMTNDTIYESDVYGVEVIGTLTNCTVNNLSIKQSQYGDGRGFFVHGVVNGLTMDNVVIDMDSEVSPTPAGDDGNYGFYLASNVSNLDINNMTIHDADIYHFYIGGTLTTASITNCTLDNFYGSGGYEMMRFNSTVTGLTMTNVTINCDQQGTTDDKDGGVGFAGAVSNATLTNVSVNESDDNGIYTWISVNNLSITGGRLTNNYDGIEFYNCNYARTNVDLVNIKIDNSTRYGILYPSCFGGTNDDVDMTGDTITNSGTAGIWVFNANVPTDITITGCVISGNGRTVTNGAGIEVQHQDNVTITQNSIYNNAGLGIDHTGNGNCNMEGALAPSITAVTPLGGGQYQVNFTIPAGAGPGTFKAEFFTNSPIAGVEGEYYVHTVSGLAVGNHTTTFTSITGPAANPKSASLTMTYTRSGASCNGTSEFSNSLALDPQGPGCVNSGIAMWIRADKLTGYADGAAVNQWTDYSGNSKKAKKFTATQQPIYRNTTQLMNFNPVVQFDGSDDHLDFPDRLGLTDTKLFTVASMIRPTTFATNPAILGGAAYGFMYFLRTDGRQVVHYHNVADLGAGTTVNTVNVPNMLMVERTTAGGIYNFYNNAKTDGTFTNATSYSTDGIARVGGSYTGTYDPLNGVVGDLIVYNRALTATERQKVNTYLSIKYGTTFDTTITKVAGAGNNYILGDGTVIWTANPTYYFRITGIGRDDCDSLQQRQSRNVDLLHPGYATMGLGTVAASNPANPNNFTADKSFLVWGDDGKSGTSSTVITGDGTITLVGGTCAQYARLSKTFKVQETGTVGNVQVQFNMIGVKLGKTAADYYLAINSTSTFTGTITKLVAATSYDNVTGVLIFDNVDFTDGQFFTVIGKRVYGPANITNNLKLWMKAEDGIAAANGGSVDIWADQGPGGNDLIQATAANQPTYYSTANLVNFNPSVRFDGVNDILVKATGALTNATVYTGATLFSVNNSENAAAGQRLFRQIGGPGSNDINIYAPFANRTIWDGPYTDRLDIANSFFTNKAFNITTGVKDNSGTNTPGFKQIVYNNGKSFGTGLGTLTYTGNNGSLSLGSNSLNSEFHNGYVGEIIFYSAALTPTERQKVNSYLSVKWGVSIDQTAPIDYLGADGTVIWDATANATYKNRITGIGRDDCSDLLQRQSRNQDTTSAYATIGLGTIAATNTTNAGTFGADKSFLLWGDDNVAGTATTTVTGDGTISLNPSACGIFRRLGKTFKTVETGTVGATQVKINLRGITLAKTAGELYLAIHSSATFTGVITKLVPATSLSGGVVTFDNVDFSGTQYFTVIGQKSQGPANLTTNLKLWVRADDGITLNGSTVSEWSDQGPGGNDAKQATVASQPTYNGTTNLINFNPSLSFNGTSNQLKTVNSIFGTGSIHYTTFGVVNSNMNGAPHRYILSDGNAACNSTVGFANSPAGYMANINWCNDLTLAPALSVGTTYLETFTRNGTTFERNNILNGLTVSTSTVGGLNKVNGTGSTIGNAPSTAEYWSGRIGEIIAFETELNAADRQKVHSYLAVKWGLSLDQTTPTNYVSANGTVIFNATTYATYKNRVTGIGRDDCSDLIQKQSKNQDAGSLVTVSNGSVIAATNDANVSTFTADNSWLLFGDNNKGLTWTGSGVPINGGNVRLNRVWRVKETGTVGTVYLEVPDNTSAQATKLPATTNSIYLLVANNSTAGKFSALSGVTVQQMTFDPTNKIWYTTYNFADGDYFTFGSEKVCIAPVGISEGLTSWHHATDMTVGAIPANTANAFSDLAFGVYPLNRNASGTATVVAGSATSFNYNRSVTLSGNASFFKSGLTNTDVIEPNAGSMFAVGTGNANLFAISSAVGNSSGLGASAMFNGTTSTYGTGVANTPNVFSMIGSTTNVTGYSNGTAGIASGSIAARAAGSYTLGFGQNGSNAVFNNGSIAESFTFNRVLDPEERLILESYLAIKYGQTLTHNYFNADYDGTNAATTTLYDVSTYSNRVFGVGTDTTGCFYQKQSTSALTGSMLKMSINTAFAAENSGNTASFIQDRSYVLAGDDNSDAGTWVTGGGANPNTPILYETTCEQPKRIARQWKVKGTYTTPTLLFAIPDATSSEMTKLPAVTTGYSVWMVINENPDFGVSAQQQEIAMTLNPLTLNWEASYQVGAGKTKYITFVMKNDAVATGSAAPTISIAVTESSCTMDDGKVLSGATVLLTPTSGASYLWNNAATTPTRTVVPTITSTYSVTVTASNGCTGTATTTLTVVTAPTASITETDNSCTVDDNKVLSNDQAVLTAGGGGTYAWDNLSTAAVRNVNPLLTSTYTVTVTDANGCTNSAASTITVVSPPTVNLTGAGVICVGEVSGVTPNSGGTWVSSDPLVATVTNAGIVTGVAGGAVVFNFTSSSTGCVSAATSPVTVNPLPVVNITGSNNICIGSTTTLSPTSGGTWASSDPAIATVANDGVVTGVAVGTATFTFTNSTTGCVSLATSIVTINALPVVNVTGATTICVGATTNLTPTSGGTWASSNNTIATVTNSGVVTALSGGTVYFTFTKNALPNCSASTVSVTVDPLPVVGITGDNVICVGETTNLSPTSGGTWVSNNPARATVDNAGLVTAVSAGSVTFTFTSTATGCASLPTPPVSIDPLPVVSITGANSICAGFTTALSPTSGGTWASSNPSVASVTNAGIVTGLTTGTTVLTFTDGTTGCVSPGLTVSVTALPVVSITGSNTICVGTTTNLSPTSGGTWTSSDPAVATVTNSGLVTGVSAGSVTFTFTSAVAPNCASTTAGVTILALPVVNITGTSTICAGSTTTLSPTTGGSWSSSNPAIATVTNGGIVTGVSAGSVTFTFTLTSTGCVSLPTSAVTVNPLPVVSITGLSSICVGFTTTLSPTTGGTWVSSDPAIATVTNAGLVTGVSAGTVSFTFTNSVTGCVSAPTATVTVNAIPTVNITGLTSICIGTMSGVSPTTGGTWTSSNPAVASIDNAGVITGVSAGSATFTFTSTATGCTSAPTPAITVNGPTPVSITGPTSVCIGFTTTLSPTNGIWMSTNPAVATVTNAGLVTGVSAGTATFIFTNTTTGCQSAPTAAITVNAPVAVSITGSSSICVSGTSALSPTSGGTWVSSDPSVATVTNAGVVTGVSAGTASFTFTNTSTGCVSAPTAAITVNALPTVSISGPNNICVGATTGLSPSSGGTWLSSNPAVATVTDAGVVTGVSAGMATFTFTNTTTGCVSAPTAAVTVNPTPTVSITGVSNICIGFTTTLSPVAGGTWVSTNPAVATVSNVGVVTGISAGTATFIFTNSATGCVSAATAPVTVEATPIVSIIGATNLCIGGMTGLSPSSGGTWVSSNPAVATVTNAGVVTAVTAGTATFTFTNTSTGCASAPTPAITVNTTPAGSITGTSTICVGATTTLSPTMGGTWTSSNPAVATVTSGGVVTGVSAGSATFTFTNTLSGCISAPTPPVTVNALPVVSITGGSNICVGGTSSVSPVTGGMWSSSNPAIATITNAGVVTGISAGTVTFTFVHGVSGCSAVTLPVTINALPVVSITGVSNICVGATTTLSPTSGGTWVSSNPGVASVTSGGVVTGVSAGTATFTFTSSTTGCVSAATSAVTVNAIPVVSITGSASVCVGSTTALTPTTGGTWTSSNPAVATVTNGGLVTAVSPGTATFTFTNTTTGCVSVATSPVTVNALPVASVTGASNICVGSTSTLTPTSGGTWSSSNPAVATVTNAGVVTGVSAGSVTFIFTNSLTGCPSVPTSAITVNASPIVSITGVNNICIGSTTTLSPTTGGTWASSNPAVASVTNGGVVLGIAAGTVTFSFTSTATGCTSAPTASVAVNGLPAVAITGSNNICIGGSTTLSPTTGGTWASSNPAVATVTNGGVVTAVGAGTVTFTFTSSSTGCASAPTAVVAVTACNSLAAVKVLLGGPYDESLDLMADNLRVGGLIPNAQPYGGSQYADFNYTGTETIGGGVLGTTGANAIVDWVMLELRSPVSPGAVLARKAALVQRDGDVVESSDGVSPVVFVGATAGSYYVAVKHRNHLGVMTAAPITLSGSVAISVNFTSASTNNYQLPGSTGSAYAQKTLSNGKRALWEGNMSNAGATGNQLRYQGSNSDSDEPYFKVLLDPGNVMVIPNYVVNAYDRSDGNMDGLIIYQGGDSDADLPFFNIGDFPDNSLFLPNFVIFEQIP